ncbi:MAG TPA: aminopeptidase N [Rhizomicrobium sp.]
MSHSEAGLKRLADYAPPSFAVEAIDLEFDLDPARTVVKSRLRIRRAAGTPVSAPLRLDGARLELLRIALNGETLGANRYAIDEDGLTLADLPDTFELEIDTAIAPARNTTRQGLFELGGKLATQCEAEGFRSITYFPDRPDVLATYRVTLHGERARYPQLLSNGNLIGQGTEADGRHWAVWDDPFPKPSYIFAVMAGDFGVLRDAHVTASGRRVALAIHADHDLIGRCGFAMEALKRSFRWDEETYGLEYDLDTFNIVALTGWAGAMENKGLNLFEAHGIVADPEITTDGDYVIIERIIGHEQFHNWTGNRVTCRDWFQLCLKEGLTRFRDQHFIEDKMADGVWRVEIVQQLRRNQFPEDEGAAAHPIQPDGYADIDNFYTNTVYDKGAEVVRMLRALLGPAVFRAGFDRYIARNDGRAATTEDFLQAMEAASGRDLAQFRHWYHQAGRPLVAARGAYDAAARRYTLTLSQRCAPTPGQADKAPFHIPVRAGLIARDGRELTFVADGARTGTAVLELTRPEQVFVFDGVAAPPIPSLLRGFSAPVSLEAGHSDEDLAVLMASDTDAFARWDAAQTLAVRLVRTLAAERAAGRAMIVPESFLSAIGRVLDAAHIDTLARAQLLTLPDEPVLSEGLARIDLDGHMAARQLLRRTIAARFRGALLEFYRAHAETVAYVPDIDGIARRRFKNAILDLLMSSGEADIAALALAQVKTSRNMTDMFEALCQLTHLDVPAREEALGWFYERWKDRSTVVDKWFNAQALSRVPGAVDRIIALERHPAFDFNNAARALLFYGGFFRQNRVAFHDPSGKGYEFLADRLLMMDKLGRSGSHYIMPQINQWRRYDPARQALMRAALERVAGTDAISKSLRENVEKALK